MNVSNEQCQSKIFRDARRICKSSRRCEVSDRSYEKRSHLRIVICLMLMLAMTATILPEPVQAAESGFTTDLVDLRRAAEFPRYAKVGKGGTIFANTVVRAPEGATLYIERRESCSGTSIYRVYYDSKRLSQFCRCVSGRSGDQKSAGYQTGEKSKADL